MQRTVLQSSWILVAALCFTALSSSSASAQSTVFTYQGTLDDGGEPASGLHDFRFRLFTVPSGGTPIGPTVCVDNVSVVEGVFTVQIDFGQQFATTAQRHLEIDVRRDTGLNCGNVAGFILMAPRQQITAAPMANHANSAFTLDAADGSPANAVFVDNEGNVGIGITSPTARLDVRGGAMVVENLGNQADLLWLASERSWVFRQEGTGAGTALKLQSIGGGGNKNLIIQTDGLVGVGTTSPLAKLDVRGDIRLGPSGQYIAPGAEETLRIIRGKVNSNGSVLEGSGFSAVRTAEGEYTITFTTPFAGTPTMVASPEYVVQQDFNIAWIDTVSPSQMRVILVNFAGHGPDDGAFHFIATGPR